MAEKHGIDTDNTHLTEVKKTVEEYSGGDFLTKLGKGKLGKLIVKISLAVSLLIGAGPATAMADEKAGTEEVDKENPFSTELKKNWDIFNYQLDQVLELKRTLQKKEPVYLAAKKWLEDNPNGKAENIKACLNFINEFNSIQENANQLETDISASMGSIKAILANAKLTKGVFNPIFSSLIKKIGEENALAVMYRITSEEQMVDVGTFHSSWKTQQEAQIDEDKMMKMLGKDVMEELSKRSG